MKILRKLRDSINLTQKELSEKISISRSNITLYETNNFPSFKIINEIRLFFKVSVDYLILEDGCNYPRSLKFVSLASKFDDHDDFESKSLIIKNINNLIQGTKSNNNIKIKQDNLTETLESSFHSNLKIFRRINNITQKQIAEKLEIVPSVVGMYEIKNYPSVDKMIKLSEIFNCSIHALVTGEKLSFDFKDKDFSQSILLADHLLSIEDKNFLIKLMSNSIKYQ